MEGKKFTIWILALLTCKTHHTVNFEIGDSSFLKFFQMTRFLGYYRNFNGEQIGIGGFTKLSIFKSYLADIRDDNYKVFFNISINSNVELAPIFVQRRGDDYDCYWMLSIDSYCDSESVEFNFGDLEIDSKKKKVDVFFSLKCTLASELVKVLKSETKMTEWKVFSNISVQTQTQVITQETEVLPKEKIPAIEEIPAKEENVIRL